MGEKEAAMKREGRGEGKGVGEERSVHRVRPGLDTFVSNQPLQVSFEAKGLFNVY